MSVVLLSGGVDSLVCAELARRQGHLNACVFVDYGHPAQIPEGWKAFAYCGNRGLTLKVVHVFGLDLGDMETEAGARVVPHRNAVLLSVAANAAKSLGTRMLIIGATAEDQEEYVDCRATFIDSMSSALGLQVVAPLIERTKLEVVRQARGLGLDPSDCWACYGPGPRPCGKCPSCKQAYTAWNTSCPE